MVNIISLSPVFYYLSFWSLKICPNAEEKFTADAQNMKYYVIYIDVILIVIISLEIFICVSYDCILNVLLEVPYLNV